jgi:hypothetical protein
MKASNAPLRKKFDSEWFARSASSSDKVHIEKLAKKFEDKYFVRTWKTKSPYTGHFIYHIYLRKRK